MGFFFRNGGSNFFVRNDCLISLNKMKYEEGHQLHSSGKIMGLSLLIYAVNVFFQCYSFNMFTVNSDVRRKKEVTLQELD